MDQKNLNSIHITKNFHKKKEIQTPNLQCRQRLLTYNAEGVVELGWQVEGIEQSSIRHSIGLLPVMLKVIFFQMEYNMIKMNTIKCIIKKYNKTLQYNKIQWNNNNTMQQNSK